MVIRNINHICDLNHQRQNTNVLYFKDLKYNTRVQIRRTDILNQKFTNSNSQNTTTISDDTPLFNVSNIIQQVQNHHQNQKNRVDNNIKLLRDKFYPSKKSAMQEMRIVWDRARELDSRNRDSNVKSEND